jgi:hypothetical protein
MTVRQELDKNFEKFMEAGFGSSVDTLDPRQVAEMRRAFMSGIFEGLNMVIRMGVDEKKDPEVFAMNLYKALKEFFEEEARNG